MKRRDFLTDCHPLTGFAFFSLMLGCTMFFLHPLCILSSRLCALAYRVRLCGAGRNLRFLLPLMLTAAVLNPLFNHEGATILAYLPGGNPLTLESILFGLAAAGLLGSVSLWLSCCTTVMSSDKIIYLFGRIAPALSLLLSMALRFIPRFRAQFRAVDESRHALGLGCADGNVPRRARNTAAVFSILITWALEGAMKTSDSMKGRGYGLGGRTAYSLYRIERRDRLTLLWLGVCALAVLTGGASGGFAWRYFPTVRGTVSSFFAAYSALCLTPVILNLWEERVWRLSQSKT